MKVDVERLVRRRARYRCEYCRLPQSASPGTHQIDHIIAEQHEELTPFISDWKPRRNASGMNRQGAKDAKKTGTRNRME
jgi:5-methylcytosine-specific restriction endonuclease McrA